MSSSPALSPRKSAIAPCTHPRDWVLCDGHAKLGAEQRTCAMQANYGDSVTEEEHTSCSQPMYMCIQSCTPKPYLGHSLILSIVSRRLFHIFPSAHYVTSQLPPITGSHHVAPWLDIPACRESTRIHLSCALVLLRALS